MLNRSRISRDPPPKAAGWQPGQAGGKRSAPSASTLAHPRSVPCREKRRVVSRMHRRSIERVGSRRSVRHRTLPGATRSVSDRAAGPAIVRGVTARGRVLSGPAPSAPPTHASSGALTKGLVRRVADASGDPAKAASGNGGDNFRRLDRHGRGIARSVLRRENSALGTPSRGARRPPGRFTGPPPPRARREESRAGAGSR